ncbi:hypothetical protein [Paenibacillus sacheonensis]|uniref:Uncharacterized protein n=1 Tax=Paenibacillus sacheonensis TaxID=742054 RepID=A0A7X4YRL5_9BACL|nr:hypothetical protein [Paenibacillus sacheonensis]MBM7567627.1 hypothetical protein [Paenibacillus sacheonensis]NBC71270.1 hypothetical protein [Paenibacillus sacheonensis]
MKNKRTAAKIAAAALMLSAIASPMAANAATVATAPLSKAYTAALTAAGEGGPALAVSASAAKEAVRISLSDPLALAKQYAPDTVPAWEQTLAAYDKLRKDTLTFTAISPAKGAGDAIFKVDGVDAGKAVTVTAPEGGIVNGQFKVEGKPVTGTAALSSIALKRVISDDGKFVTVTDDEGNVVFKAPNAGDGKPVFTTSAAGSALGVSVSFSAAAKAEPAVQSGDLLKAVGPISLTKGADAAGTIAITKEDGDGKAAFTLRAAGPIDDPFFNGQIALSKAADAKDAEAIKAALSKLLDLYKAEIVKLQQAE